MCNKFNIIKLIWFLSLDIVMQRLIATSRETLAFVAAIKFGLRTFYKVTGISNFKIWIKVDLARDLIF